MLDTSSIKFDNTSLDVDKMEFADMHDEIDQFLAELPDNIKSSRSKLAPYEKEIFELKRRGCTEAVILLFLAQKRNVKVAQSTLNFFIRSRLKNTRNHIESAASKQRKSPERPNWMTKKALDEIF